MSQTFDFKFSIRVTVDVVSEAVPVTAAIEEPVADPATPATGGGPAKTPRTKKDKPAGPDPDKRFSLHDMLNNKKDGTTPPTTPKDGENKAGDQPGNNGTDQPGPDGSP